MLLSHTIMCQLLPQSLVLDICIVFTSISATFAKQTLNKSIKGRTFSATAVCNKETVCEYTCTYTGSGAPPYNAKLPTGRGQYA